MWKLLIGAFAGYLVGRSTSGKQSENLRVLAKASLKTGIQVFEKGYEAASHLREALEDVVAETRADLATEAAATQRAQDADAPQQQPQKQRRRPASRGTKPRNSSRHASTSHH